MRLFELFLAGLSLVSSVRAADSVVFGDSLAPGWENWSWASVGTVSSPTHGGSSAFSISGGPWEAIYLHNSGAVAGNFTGLRFWINGGAAGGQKLLVQGIAGNNPRSYVEIPTLAPDTWTQVQVTLEQLGVAGDSTFDGFWIQDRSGNSFSNFYLDDIVLTGGGVVTNPATNAVVRIEIDTTKGRRPISDLIYGVAFATSNQLKELNSPLNRSGGNPESRYNWEQNAANRAFDWYFESIGGASSQPGGDGDEFVAGSKGGDAEAMLTIPLLEWVAKLGPGRGKLASFSVAKYGAQTGTDAQWFPDAGNGISRATGKAINNNDPNDASVKVDSTFQQNWVRHLTNRWGSAAQGGVRYYLMDNEPSIWHSTHRDVVKTGLKMGELVQRTIDHASKVRAVDPGAIIAGPEEWGWSGYIYSGYDQQWGAQNGWGNLPDRTANGGMDYLPFYLDQLRKYEQTNGTKLIDVFTVHYYPQSGEYGDTHNVSTAMQTLRNRSTRSLWDTNYTDQSWISDKVRLIPRLKQWVTQYYPGLKIGITEYSWGADEHINGATTQADILGIFGREGLDLATRWVVPDAGTPAFNAFKMYRNYDGHKSTFGNESVSALAPNPDKLSAFAALRASDRALTLMVINKVTGAIPVELALNNFSHTGKAQRWELTSANQITPLPDITFTGPVLTNSVSSQSITLFILPQAAADLALTVLPAEQGKVILQIAATFAATVKLQKSTNFQTWTEIQTFTLQQNPILFTNTTSSTAEFFRLVQ